MPMPLDLPICDPHFHIWDESSRPNPNLGGITATLPVYTAARLRSEAAQLALRSAVHVEAIVGQAPGGYVLDTVGESAAVMRQAGDLGGPVVLVAYVHLGRADAAETIARHREAAGAAFVGVRMIMNYHATESGYTWPQVERGDFLTGGCPEFEKGCVRGARGSRRRAWRVSARAVRAGCARGSRQRAWV